MHLEFSLTALVVIAGVPGAGKTTLIDRAVDRGRVRVVDTEDQRRAGHRRRPKPLRVLVHYLRIVRAIVGGSPAVVHSRGTRTATRRLLALLARLRGRPAHLVLVVADADEAIDGQRSRGRVVAADEMRGHVRRFARLAARPAGEIAAAEGWADVTVVDRAGAARIDAFRFTAPALAPANRSDQRPATALLD